MVNQPAPHHRLNMFCLYVCILYVTDGPHCTPYHSWKEISPTLRPFLKISSLLRFILSFWGLGSGGVINIWPIKSFEDVAVINGYANNILLN